MQQKDRRLVVGRFSAIACGTLIALLADAGEPAPSVMSSGSRKAHGNAGSFDVPLTLTGTPGIEPRSGGATGDHEIVVTFDSSVSVTGNPQAQVTTGIGEVGSNGSTNGGAVTVSGNSVIVPLTNVANAQTISVTLNSVSNGSGESTSIMIPMSVLVGDANRNAAVNATDAAQIKSRVGEVVIDDNFRADVNATGSINATDVAIAKSHIGSGVLPQWLSDSRLTNDPAFASTSFNNARSIAVGDTGPGAEVLHLIFFEERDGNREIYYKRSTNEGASWDPDIRLTNNAAISHFPSIASSGAVVHVVWEEYRDGNAEIYYKRSPDAGTSWGADTRLTNNPAHSFSPSVAVFDNHVHLVWYDLRDGNSEEYYKRSDDGGLSWGADTRLTNNAAGSTLPAIAVSGTIVHIAWEEHRHGNGEIYYKRSTDGGVTWGTDTRLTNNGASSADPSIAAAGSDVNIAWFDQRDGNLEIYDKHSAENGLSWAPDKRVTNNAAVSNYPSVSLSGSSAHLVWFDERDGNTEIYYNRSNDRGATWGADIRLTNNAARSTDPCVAVSSSNVHVVWTDARDNNPTYTGNYEIYHKRKPLE